jgi:DsbC/DsbD-like thiol-disulfide interchange protein
VSPRESHLAIFEVLLFLPRYLLVKAGLNEAALLAVKVDQAGMVKLAFSFLLMSGAISLLIAAPTLPEIKLEAPSAAQRINMAVAFGRSSEKDIPVFVKVRLAPGYHIYALENTNSLNQATEIETKLPAGLRLDGPWHGPEPKKLSDGSRVYENQAVFTNVLKGTLKGEKLEITVSFQVCNELVCWPPEKLVREAVFEKGRK